jgi:acetyl-CoA carboxylase biotin carboxyl carrier protein
MKKPSGVRSDESASLVDIASIDQLAKIVARYDLSEVEIDLGELRVRVARERGVAPGQPAASPVAVATPAAPIADPVEAAPAAESPGTVRSPMVGTAYLRPNPETKPFVEVGTVVKAGDKLLLVEAMKTFNDIVAPRAGKVVSILVEEGAPVEYGQPLMVVE